MQHEPKLPTVDDLAAVYALESVKGFGPQKFRALADAGLSPRAVIARPSSVPFGGKTGESLKSSIGALTPGGLDVCRSRAEGQLSTASRLKASILLHGDPRYPVNLWRSNNPVPVLYVIGNVELLGRDKAVACVGSRKIAGEYEDSLKRFAAYAARNHWVIVSGFALGADTVAHTAAWEAGGATVGVMPGGLDRPFPPENRGLWRELLAYSQAAFVSEFAFGTAAAALTLRKRNKTIVALSRGVVVGQSAISGGAMNAFRFGIEQRKPVASFRPDSTEATGGNRKIAEHELGTKLPLSDQDNASWSKWLAVL